MASRFVENLDTTAPITHPHLNVSLDDILAEEGRKRSSSHSSESSQTSGRRSGSDAPTSPASPTAESKMETIRRRALTLGSKKGRRTSWSNQESRFFFKKKMASQTIYPSEWFQHHHLPSGSWRSSQPSVGRDRGRERESSIHHCIPYGLISKARSARFAIFIYNSSFEDICRVRLLQSTSISVPYGISLWYYFLLEVKIVLRDSMGKGPGNIVWLVSIGGEKKLREETRICQ